MKPLLSAEDRLRIEQTITELERQSALELVVAVVPRSSGYTGFRALAAAFWALAAGLLCVSLLPPTLAYLAILAELPAGALAYALLGSGLLGRWLIPDRDLEGAVGARAFQLFTECGIHNTRQGTGVLLLLSEFEHRAVILGDHAVHAVIGAGGWQREADRLIAQIRAGRAADGVLEVIRDLSAALSTTFPRAADDVNELPNRVLRRD